MRACQVHRGGHAASAPSCKGELIEAASTQVRFSNGFKGLCFRDMGGLIDTLMSRRRTVRVILGGGLGNQLFMYAAGRALALRVGAKLVLDSSQFRFDHTYKRVYLLDRFPVEARIADDRTFARLRSLGERGLRRFPAVASRWGLWDEPVRNGLPVHDPRLLAPPPGQSISLRGNWQSARYFADAADRIRQELSPPKPRESIALGELAEIRASADPTAVCIRFYREVPGESSDPAKTIAAFRDYLMRRHLAGGNAKYFVFTESPAYLANPKCLGVPFTLISHRPRNEDAPGDLHLIAHCRSFVIGYSSFHWWGAWLAPVAGKQVTYLQFPGRPGRDYADQGWKIVPVPA